MRQLLDASCGYAIDDGNSTETNHPTPIFDRLQFANYAFTSIYGPDSPPPFPNYFQRDNNQIPYFGTSVLPAGSLFSPNPLGENSNWFAWWIVAYAEGTIPGLLNQMGTPPNAPVMQEKPKLSELAQAVNVICTALFVVCVLLVLGVGSLAMVSLHNGITRRPILAATNRTSYHTLVEALDHAISVTSLSSATQKNIIKLDDSTYVWKIIGDNSALMVLVETGPCKGKILWVRAEDFFIGGSVM